MLIKGIRNMMGDEKKKNRVFEITRQCMLLLVGSLVISFTCIACVSESAENREITSFARFPFFVSAEEFSRLLE